MANATISAGEERKLTELSDGITALLGAIAADTYSQSGQTGRGISDALQFGGRFPAFLHMFVEHRLYSTIKEGPYEEFRNAMHGADRELLPEVARQIKERGIRTIYSLGPTPSLDAELLKMLAEQNVHVKYVAVDISPSVLIKAEDKLSRNLGEQSGSVTLDRILGSFESVNSDDKSCVTVTGGTVSNNPDSLWSVAAKIAKPGGLVVADSGVTPEHTSESSAYWKQYWLSMYNTPAQRKMLMKGLEQSMPDFFTPENRQKWQLRIGYVPHTGSENWKERCTTPRIQVEMHVNTEMDVAWAGLHYHLMPSQVIVPIVSVKPDSLSFVVKSSGYGLRPIAAKETTVDYSIGGGPKAGAFAAMFEVK